MLTPWTKQKQEKTVQKQWRFTPKFRDKCSLTNTNTAVVRVGRGESHTGDGFDPLCPLGNMEPCRPSPAASSVVSQSYHRFYTEKRKLSLQNNSKPNQHMTYVNTADCNKMQSGRCYLGRLWFWKQKSVSVRQCEASESRSTFTKKKNSRYTTLKQNLRWEVTINTAATLRFWVNFGHIQKFWRCVLLSAATRPELAISGSSFSEGWIVTLPQLQVLSTQTHTHTHPLRITSHAPWHGLYGNISSSTGANHPLRTPVEPTQHIILMCQQLPAPTEEKMSFSHCLRGRSNSLALLAVVVWRVCPSAFVLRPLKPESGWWSQHRLTADTTRPLLPSTRWFHSSSTWKWKATNYKIPSAEFFNCSASNGWPLSLNRLPQHQHLCRN